jgi:hypothetical protein
MFIQVTSATITPGKTAEAIAFWKRLAAAMKKQSEVVDCFVMRPLQGLVGRIMLSCRYSSLEAYVKCSRRLEQDPEYQGLAKEHIERRVTVANTMERAQYSVAD